MNPRLLTVALVATTQSTPRENTTTATTSSILNLFGLNLSDALTILTALVGAVIAIATSRCLHRCRRVAQKQEMFKLPQMPRTIQIVSFAFVVVGLAACSYTAAPRSVEAGSDVGGTGDVGYTHEQLGAGKHLVTVTAAPGVMETEGSIEQRIHVFANRFAARTCQGAFEFVHDPNFDQSVARGFMKRTKTYVFVCRG